MVPTQQVIVMRVHSGDGFTSLSTVPSYCTAAGIKGRPSPAYEGTIVDKPNRHLDLFAEIYCRSAFRHRGRRRRSGILDRFLFCNESKSKSSNLKHLILN